MRKLIAGRTMRYAGYQLVEGATFEARERDAVLFLALGFARAASGIEAFDKATDPERKEPKRPPGAQRKAKV